MARNPMTHDLKYGVDLYRNGLRMPARNLPENTTQGVLAIAETFGADAALVRYLEDGKPKAFLIQTPKGWAEADEDLFGRMTKKGGGR